MLWQNQLHRDMCQFAEFVVLLLCSLFAGPSVYISLVEHPARMACGVELATLGLWARSRSLRSSPGRHSGGSLREAGSVLSSHSL